MLVLQGRSTVKLWLTVTREQSRSTMGGTGTGTDGNRCWTLEGLGTKMGNSPYLEKLFLGPDIK